MQNLRRFLICCLIWVGLLPGRTVLAADTSAVASDPAARARAEVERQGKPAAVEPPAAADVAQQQTAVQQARAKALAGRQNTAPGAPVRYATSRPVKVAPQPTAEDLARQERLQRIEREVARRRAEREGQSPDANPAPAQVANRPAAVSPVPPPLASEKAATVATPVVVPVQNPTLLQSEDKQKARSARERLAADRARLDAEREAARQHKAVEKQQREGLTFTPQTPPPAPKAAPAPAPAPAPASATPDDVAEAARKAKVREVQNEVEARQYAQNASGSSLATGTAPASALPVLSPEQERKARELLRQTMAEMEKEESAGAPAPSKKSRRTKSSAKSSAPASSPAPAPAASPAPTATPAPTPELELRRQEEQARAAARERSRVEAERVEAERKAKAAQAKLDADRAEAERRSKQAEEKRASEQAKAEAKAQAEQAKANVEKARANAKLDEAKAKLHARSDAERAADAQAKSALSKTSPVAAAAAPEAKPAAVPTTKAEKLAALLKAYTRSDSPISAEEYHRERAKIIAEP